MLSLTALNVSRRLLYHRAHLIGKQDPASLTPCSCEFTTNIAKALHKLANEGIL